MFIPAVKEAESRLKCTSDVNYRESIADNNSLPLLSDREKDVLICVAKDMSNKEIAEQLYVSVNKVSTHRRNISSKLDIHSGAGLTIYAIINGLVDLPDSPNQ